MADNWYLVLELEFDPPEENEEVIARRIDEKAKFWSANFNNFQKGAQYRTWHQNLPKIRADMIGPDNIRKQLATDACAQVYGPLDKLLKVVARKGNITTSELEGVAKKAKVDVAIADKRREKLGIPLIPDTNEDAQKIYDKYYKEKPKGTEKYDNLTPMLKAFGVDDLYAFLYSDTPTENAHKLPTTTLRDRVTEKKKQFFKHNAESGNGSKLCGQCELTFKDDQSRAEYDAYLEYARRKAILMEVKTVGDISHSIDALQFKDFTAQLVQLLRDQKLAESILTAFCRIEGFAIPQAEQTRTETAICRRCGRMNDLSDGREKCSNCGTALKIICPQCKTVCADAGVKVCKCGFQFKNIDSALAMCALAEKRIDGLELDAAEFLLTDAETLWPGNPESAPLRKKLQDYKQRVGKEVEKMRRAMESKNYFEAQKQYKMICSIFSGYSDEAIRTQIDESISKAQGLLAQAKAARAESDVLNYCAQAYELCHDLPGVRELMPAPPQVTGFAVKANPETRANIISWTATSDRSIRFVVVRSKTGWIQNPAEGETLFRGSASSYADSAIEPGVAYYYNVFAERAGIFSPGAKGEFRETVNLFEITGVTATAADASLSISWGVLPKNATAEIFQIADNGTEKQIASSTMTTHLVSGLENDRKYRFRVALSYNINGKAQKTKGVLCEGIPTCPPLPVEIMRVKPMQNGTFEAIWEQQPGADVRIYSATQKPRFKLGDIVSLTDLEREMQPLPQRPLSAASAQSLSPQERGMTFTHNSQQMLYISAVVVKSGTAVFGALGHACVGETVTVKSIRVANGKLVISIAPPATASGFVVLYRHDRFPSGIEDSSAQRKYFTSKTYQQESALTIDSPEDKKYFISVFAEFRRDGERDYSASADELFDNSAKVNITYSIAVSRKLFGDSEAVLEFSADSSPFMLPDIDIMSAVGNAPMFKRSAQLMHTVPAQQVSGSVTVRIPLKGVPRNTYIKAFFRDEAAQKGSQLKLKLNSNYKIT